MHMQWQVAKYHAMAKYHDGIHAVVYDLFTRESGVCPAILFRVMASNIKGTNMALEWIYSSENVDWEELSRLYLAAPLGHESPSDLKVAFSNSMFMCFVYDSGRLIAVGRALADGRDCSYICGVAVHPEYQGIGIGKEVVTKLVTLSKEHKKIILYAAVRERTILSKTRLQTHGNSHGNI